MQDSPAASTSPTKGATKGAMILLGALLILVAGRIGAVDNLIEQGQKFQQERWSVVLSSVGYFDNNPYLLHEKTGNSISYSWLNSADILFAETFQNNFSGKINYIFSIENYDKFNSLKTTSHLLYVPFEYKLANGFLKLGPWLEFSELGNQHYLKADGVSFEFENLFNSFLLKGVLEYQDITPRLQVFQELSGDYISFDFQGEYIREIMSVLLGLKANRYNKKANIEEFGWYLEYYLFHQEWYLLKLGHEQLTTNYAYDQDYKITQKDRLESTYLRFNYVVTQGFNIYIEASYMKNISNFNTSEYRANYEKVLCGIGLEYAL